MPAEPRSDRRAGAATTIAVAEPLKGRAVERWHRIARAAMAQRPPRLVLDLSDTPSVDETALVMLLQVHHAMLRADGRLILRAPQPRVRRMLALGRIDHVLDIEQGDADHHPATPPRWPAAATVPHRSTA